MNERGHYGNATRTVRSSLGPRGRGYAVGGQIMHTLELRQRYENATLASVQALLSSISAVGTVTSPAANRWDIVLRDGGSVRLSWDPDYRALTVGITDRRSVPADQVESVQRYYESILARDVAPRLTSFGAVAIGRAVTVGAFLGLFHTVAERDEAMASLSRDVEALHGELTRQILHATPEHPYGLASDTTIKPEWLSWWQSKATKFFKDFNEWRAERSPANWTRFGGYIAYGTTWATDWDVYKRWRDQLAALRKDAAKLGIDVKTSAPTELPTTIVEDVEDVAKSLAKKAEEAGKEVWSTSKYLVFGVLGIGAIVALASVASNLKTGTDPAEKYVSLIRESRKARASRAPRAARELPAREQLALPAGA